LTGKRYYLTTLGDWRGQVHRMVHSHWVAITETRADPAADDQTPIAVVVEGDEGAHLALEGDPSFEALPHPLSQDKLSVAAQEALAPHGVSSGATAFDVAEALGRIHPLLKYRVF